MRHFVPNQGGKTGTYPLVRDCFANEEWVQKDHFETEVLNLNMLSTLRSHVKPAKAGENTAGCDLKAFRFCGSFGYSCEHSSILTPHS